MQGFGYEAVDWPAAAGLVYGICMLVIKKNDRLRVDTDGRPLPAYIENARGLVVSRRTLSFVPALARGLGMGCAHGLLWIKTRVSGRIALADSRAEQRYAAMNDPPGICSHPPTFG